MTAVITHSSADTQPVRTGGTQHGFDDFYAASFPILRSQLYAYLGDRAEAQDLVQEAFCRAFAKWRSISGYSDPFGWVRRVAWNLATSKFRRQRTANRHLRRQREEHADGPSPDRVALVRALSKIPPQLRKAIVLHYIGQLSVAEIALQETTAGPAMPGAHVARATAAHRREIRLTMLSVLGVLLVVAPIAAFAANPRGNNSPPDIAATPTATASAPAPSPSPSPSTPPKPITIEELVAAKAKIPKFSTPGCPATALDNQSASQMEFTLSVKKVVETNLDDDADLETAAWVLCEWFEPESEHGRAEQVVAYERGEGGSIVNLGAVVGDLLILVGLEARPGGGVVVTVAYDTHFEPGAPANQRREFAWKDGAFRQVGGPTGFFEPANADLKLTVIGNLLWPQAGQSTATLMLRLENKGPEDAPRLEIQVSVPGLIKVVGENGETDVLVRPELKAGKTLELKLTLTLDPNVIPANPLVYVYSSIIETDYDDNTASIPVVYQ